MIRRIAMLFLAALACAGTTTFAGTVVEHVGATDPVDQGWIRDLTAPTGGVLLGPVTDDLGLGVNAWMTDDNADNGRGRYFVYLSDETIASATAQGWRLVVKLRVVDVPDPASGGDLAEDGSPIVRFRDHLTDWMIRFGTDINGNVRACLQTVAGPAGQRECEEVAVEGGTSEYRTYELVFDPVRNAADFIVDGEILYANYTGAPYQGTTLVGWGAFGTPALGHANFALVRFEVCGGAPSSPYGMLVFDPRCTRSSSELPQDEYDRVEIGIHRRAEDTYYVSSSGSGFSPVVADDSLVINGQDSGAGPYATQPGVPPYHLGAPIETNLVPEPSFSTDTIPVGTGQVLVQLLDTDRVVHGNTALFFVRDCGIWMDVGEAGETALHWVSHEVEVNGATSNLDVVSGLLSDLQQDRDFSRACVLGNYSDAARVVDERQDPPAGDAFYYLVDGTCASDLGYGSSSAGPRTGLPPASSCAMW